MTTTLLENEVNNLKTIINKLSIAAFDLSNDLGVEKKNINILFYISDDLINNDVSQIIKNINENNFFVIDKITTKSDKEELLSKTQKSDVIISVIFTTNKSNFDDKISNFIQKINENDLNKLFIITINNSSFTETYYKHNDIDIFIIKITSDLYKKDRPKSAALYTKNIIEKIKYINFIKDFM